MSLSFGSEHSEGTRSENTKKQKNNLSEIAGANRAFLLGPMGSPIGNTIGNIIGNTIGNIIKTNYVKIMN